MTGKRNPFWGHVEADWAGFSAEKKITLPSFEKESEIFLGEEYDEDGEELETLPTPEMLDSYEQTFRQLLEDWDEILVRIKEAAFARYLRVYAHYFEDEAVSGEPPLGIDTAEKHFEYMQDLNYIRLLDEGAVKLCIFYEKIDSEHGLEIQLVEGKVTDIGGIAET